MAREIIPWHVFLKALKARLDAWLVAGGLAMKRHFSGLPYHGAATVMRNEEKGIGPYRSVRLTVKHG
jgi:hypothetical protein